MLPLLARIVEWIGLPREMRVVFPVALGLAMLAGAEGRRRAAAITGAEDDVSKNEEETGAQHLGGPGQAS